jgi:hypothetical protein
MFRKEYSLSSKFCSSSAEPEDLRMWKQWPGAQRHLVAGGRSCINVQNDTERTLLLG